MSVYIYIYMFKQHYLVFVKCFVIDSIVKKIQL